MKVQGELSRSSGIHSAVKVWEEIHQRHVYDPEDSFTALQLSLLPLLLMTNLARFAH
jgi:hypothetical protein